MTGKSSWRRELGPAHLELHVDVREEQDHDHERHGQVDGGRPAEQLERPASRALPVGHQPGEGGDADQVALDREEREEPGRVETGPPGRAPSPLDHDGQDHQRRRCRAHDRQFPPGGHRRMLSAATADNRRMDDGDLRSWFDQQVEANAFRGVAIAWRDGAPDLRVRRWPRPSRTRRPSRARLAVRGRVDHQDGDGGHRAPARRPRPRQAGSRSSSCCRRTSSRPHRRLSIPCTTSSRTPPA